jgi:uncharacterized protein
MPAIRDLIVTLRSRPGVDSVLVVGRDGLVIDGEGADGGESAEGVEGAEGVDGERVAAHLPALIAAADAFGAAAGRGALTTAVVEHERAGLAVLSVLSPEVALLVLLDASADAGPLLYELRHERARLLAFV